MHTHFHLHAALTRPDVQNASRSRKSREMDRKVRSRFPVSRVNDTRITKDTQRAKGRQVRFPFIDVWQKSSQPTNGRHEPVLHTSAKHSASIFSNNCVCVLLVPYVCVAGVTLDAKLLARRQYSEGPATGELDTGFSWFPCVYKQMLRRLPTFQVATTCFSCSPPDLNLNLSVTIFIFCLHVK